ncbi:4 TMS phage holin, superfamily IV [Agromyces sp. CF514]|uniref:phage holin family protein n=1 Tax=Agromyces sp. CF514 TaxID=1881031 RepID=UPI0008E70182|nr:phage holin family protein [Agromyces sp. CF514]SFR90453.1 4 TMS phage holin, superfamily IV [Agromyces sp. CF514]
MVRTLVNLAIFLATAALALLLASLLVPGFHVHPGGFIVAIIVFAIAQALVEWLVRSIFHRSAPTVAGIAGLLSTFLALWITSLFGGVSFDGLGGWILATVVVWLVTAILGWVAAKFITPRFDRKG